MPFPLQPIRAAVPGLHLLSDADLAALVAEIAYDFGVVGREVSQAAIVEELREVVRLRTHLLASF